MSVRFLKSREPLQRSASRVPVTVNRDRKTWRTTMINQDKGGIMTPSNLVPDTQSVPKQAPGTAGDRSDAVRARLPQARRRTAAALIVGLVATLAALVTSTAMAPSAAAQQYCYDNSVTSTKKSHLGIVLAEITDKVTVCVAWNANLRQYRIKSWSAGHPTHRQGPGWEFVDWSGTYMTGGNGHLAFNSYVRGNFKFCVGVGPVSGCPNSTYATTRISFQLINTSTGQQQAQWVTSK
jgi:hypothetical protein